MRKYENAVELLKEFINSLSKNEIEKLKKVIEKMESETK